jgi:hypothetical protein
MHKVLSPVLRTKANADHAGHSVPLVLSKALTSLQPKPSSPSLNNNLLIAQPKTQVAMVVQWILLSLTLNLPPLRLRMLTHTPVRMAHALLTVQVLLAQLATQMLPPTTQPN